jgi:AraC-like DNA-binding protein
MHFLTISENIFLFISGVGFLQGFLLAALIYFHPKSDRTVSKFLAFYIVCLSIIMTGPLFLKMISWKDSFFVAPFPVLAGPLMYFYIVSFKETITWRKAFPHLILFFIYSFATYWWLSDLANKYPDAKDFPKQAFRSPLSLVFFGVRYIQLISYYFFSKHALLGYQNSIRELFSETSRINLNWVKWLINGYLIIILASVLIFVLMSKYPEHFYLLYLINIAIATPYIYIATYKGITQPTIWQRKDIKDKQQFEQQIQVSEAVETAIRKKDKLQQTEVTDNRSGEIIKKITLLMEEEKLYQEPELTLQDLADKLQLPPYQVSQVINEGMKKKFYELVNGYRVEEAKRLLLHPKNRNYTILSVGFEAGFNSKTTFNTVFKKFTGLTPTEFREESPLRV